MCVHLAKIEEGVPGALSFLANPHYEPYLYETQSTIVLVNRDFEAAHPVAATLVRVDNAYEAIAQLLKLYEQATQKRKGVHPLAYVDATAVIGEDCYVAPFAYVGEGVVVGRGTQLYSHVVIEAGARVGEDCLFYPNVTVYHGCVIGNRVTLHAGCVIGADGFGFAPTPDGYDKIPQIGIVTLEDDVEIGANTCVDRSTMGSTVVRRGVKLDNLVQVGPQLRNRGAHGHVGPGGRGRLDEDRPLVYVRRAGGHSGALRAGRPGALGRAGRHRRQPAQGACHGAGFAGHRRQGVRTRQRGIQETA